MKRIALVGLLLLIPVGGALATASFGILEATVQARGTLADDQWGKIKVRSGTDVAVQKIRIAPGGHTGWHSHPGSAVVVVKAGALTLYEGDDRKCRPTTYPAGSTFVDVGHGNVHIGRNEGSVEVELWVTYFEVPVGGSFRLDVDPAPGNCPF
jgi:quercetin dioxygenase-like cupin family protein